MKPKIVTLDCLPDSPPERDGSFPALDVPVPEGWDLHTVIQAGPLPLPSVGIRLQALIVPLENEPDMRLQP